MNNVPSELKWKILLFLPGVPNIVKCSRIDKGFFEPAKNDNFWKDVLFLNFKDVFNSGLISPEKLLKEQKTYFHSTKLIFLGMKRISSCYTVRKATDGYYGGNEMNLRIVGVGAVGKTSIVDRYFKGEFYDNNNYYISGIEDSYSKNVDLFNIEFTLDVLDTAGQEEYAALRDAYMKNGDGFLLVFDLTDPLSLENLEEFFKQILIVKSVDMSFPMVCVGNKFDLADERKIEEKEIIKIISEKFGGKPYIETSAKTDYNVNEAFLMIMKEVLRYKLWEWCEGNLEDDLGYDNFKEKKKKCLIL